MSQRSARWLDLAFVAAVALAGCSVQVTGNGAPPTPPAAAVTPLAPPITPVSTTQVQVTVLPTQVGSPSPPVSEGPSPTRPKPPPTPKPTPKPTLVVTIPAPVYQQAMPLDCETSALRMSLAYYGHYYTDAQLFAAEPVDLRPPVMGPNHTVLQWGNPYTHFVGNVYGAQATPTGYGVYYPVIVSLARSHGLPNTVGGEDYSPATVYAELRSHHPVEVWVEYNWRSYQTGVWTAWDGTKIRYAYGEHAVTLTGVSATQVRVNDPAHGTQYWIDKATFEAHWRVFNNMAVIFK